MGLNLIPNLRNACAVLRLLGSSKEGLSQAEIEGQLKLPRATTYRILTTLTLEGMSRKVGSKYFIGHAMAQFALKAMSSLSIQEIGKPVLEELANQVGETAHIAVPSGPQSLIVGVHDSPNPIRVASQAGSLADIHCSSTGKLFLADLSEEELDHILSTLTLNSRTPKTLVTAKALKAELDKVREQNYAIDEEEYFQDVRCLAAPIREASNKVIAAIGITGTSSRFSQARNEEVRLIVQSAAKKIESQLMGG
ncbi:MAG: IclR family transcriptional regulator [Planctomycetes bacterium]|nr:IclR family transcriptional regulator [Planctomycetota bacterium]